MTEPMVAPGGLEAAREIAEGADEVVLRHWNLRKGGRFGIDADKRELSYDPSDGADVEYQRVLEQAKLRFRADRKKALKWGGDPTMLEAAANIRAHEIVKHINDEPPPRLLQDDSISPEEVARVLVARSKPEELVSLYATLGDPGERQILQIAVDAKVGELSRTEPNSSKHFMYLGAKRAISLFESLANGLNVDDCRTPMVALRDTTIPKRKPRNGRFDPGYLYYAGPSGPYNYCGQPGAWQELSTAMDAQKVMDRARKHAREAAGEGDGKTKAAKAAAEAAKRTSSHGFRPGTTEAKAVEEAHEAAKRISEPPGMGKNPRVVSAELRWAPEKMAFNSRPPMAVARKICRSDHGSRILRPMKFETDPEARGFGRRMAATGAMIVVDCSGSMGVSDEQLRQIMIDAPASTIIGYSGDGKGRYNVALLADGNRIRSKDPQYTGMNACDFSALQWGFENRRGRPVLWACDFGVSGVVAGSKPGEEYEAFDIDHQALIADYYVANSDWIGRCHGVRNLLEVIHDWKAGMAYLPEDTRIPMSGGFHEIPRRQIGTYA